MFFPLALLAMVQVAWTAFCGSSAIPYSLEVLPSGATVMGCARPNCFGWDPNTGMHASDDAGFYNLNDHADGFMRDGPQQRPPFDTNDPRISPQTADCNPTFVGGCGPNEWVGGLMPTMNNSSPLQVQCCSYPALANAADRGIATVHEGQIVIGGEAMENGQQTGFDYIRSVDKRFHEDGTYHYEVGIGRMQCDEIPTQPPQPFIQNQAPFQQPFVQPQPPPQAVFQPVNPPQVFYQPVGGAVGGGGGGYYCFTDDSMVRMIDGSEKRMDELVEGDWVQVLSATKSGYAPVTFWQHRVPSLEAEFVKLTLQDGNELKLTGKHYIYKADCSDVNKQVSFTDVTNTSVFAEEVHEGDCLYSVPFEGKPTVTKVIHVTNVKQTGIYSPMTTMGNIVVNGIHTSCHTLVPSDTLQTSFFGYVNYIHKLYSQLFTSSSENDVRELPLGMETIMSMVDFVIPKKF